jgi:hypothetical protein
MIYTGLSEETFKVLSNPEADPGEGWAVVGCPWAEHTGVKGKGAGSCISSDTWEKQLGEDPTEHRASGTSGTTKVGTIFFQTIKQPLRLLIGLQTNSKLF